MTARLADEDTLIKYCDREPIHCPGSVQPRGVLFACPDPSWTVTHVSANVAEIFGVAARDVIGQNLKAVLGKALLDRLNALLPHLPSGNIVPGRLFGVALPKGQDANVSVHIHDGRRVVEVEPLVAPVADAPVDLVQLMLPSLQQARTLNDLCQTAAAQLRGLIGYDRVMIYKFLPDGSGQVIAEACGEGLQPYLHLRYPASDIPSQARELYRKNWVRLISDVNAQQVPMWAEDRPQLQPLDMSYADLRSVSPVHIQYLKNMGVGASMSISIIVGGALWGLIACHHRTAREVPAHLRSAAELFGQTFSLQIRSVEGVEAYVTFRAARAYLDRIVAEFPAGGDIGELADHLEQLAALIPCDGAGLLIDGAWRGFGLLPSGAEVEALADDLQETKGDGVFSTHRLSELHAPSTTWQCGLKGMMAVSLSARNDWLFFFRKEMAGTVTWGGDPNKAVTADASGSRLLPRMSFAAWTEAVRGQSRPFTSRERLIGDTMRLCLRDVIVRYGDAVADARRHAELKLKLLTGEHNKRIRATLDLIRSLVDPGSEADRAVRSYVRALDQRIRSVALAHDAASSPFGSDLNHLVETSLADSGRDDGRITAIAGPKVKLDPKAYTVLAVVFHELTSLSAASGALSSASGRLAVTWAVEDLAGVTIEWVETGSKVELAPEAASFGLSLVRRNIPQILGGDAEAGFTPDGLKARFVIPHRYVQEGPDDARARKASFDEASPRVLDGFAILLVEDDEAAGDHLELAMRRCGAAVVFRAATAVEALELIASGQPDVAVLDIDLGSATSIPVADMLSAQDIPFLFADDGKADEAVPSRHADVLIVKKPYCGATVPALLQEALLPRMIRAVLGSGGEPGQPGA